MNTVNDQFNPREEEEKASFPKLTKGHDILVELYERLGD